MIATTFETRMERFESKYIIPRAQVAAMREFIRPFCEPDSYAQGDPPEYGITTLQLDTPDLALHRAKDNELNARFKLRARTYNEPGSSKVYLEVKRKYGRTIIKSRAGIPFASWNRDLIYSTKPGLSFKSKSEEIGFLEFVRLARQINAVPVALIRYTRESYFGTHDPYARISFDRRLVYQRTTRWDSWGRNGHWLSMDTAFAQDKDLPYSGCILEIKTLNDAPHWMLDLVSRFNISCAGNCKYSSAVWQEMLFDPQQPGPRTMEDLSHF